MVAGESKVLQAKEQPTLVATVLILSNSQLMHVVTASCTRDAWLMLEKVY